ncbi:MAG: outer membrane protein assembly factor BamD [Mariprofundaceae bacterium]|nr:outer membrane protein assembly factor BamD [Mariprofundaceae bacterium]
MKRPLFLCLMLLALLSACVSSDIESRGSAELDYELAKKKLADGLYSEVNIFLADFSAKHPYSHYAIQAELLRAFAAYKGEEYILAETLCEQFIKRHPRHPDVAYAKYLLGMAHYKQVVPPERDPGQTMAAIKSFRELIKDHPDSPYARDGASRLQKLYNNLAEHEVTVGKYYFDRGDYVAAANRFQVVIERYQTTPSIEEALYYLAASYAKLGIMNSARDTAILLRHNYPGGSWSEKAARFL